MKKRLLAGLLTVVMLFSMLPVSALAADNASVGTYSELQTAINNASVSAITLTADIEVEGTLTVNRELTIYGNGYTITRKPVDGQLSGTVSESRVTDETGASVTEYSYNVSEYVNYAAFSVTSSGVLTLDNVILDGKAPGWDYLKPEAGETWTSESTSAGPVYYDASGNRIYAYELIPDDNDLLSTKEMITVSGGKLTLQNNSAIQNVFATETCGIVASNSSVISIKNSKIFHCATGKNDDIGTAIYLKASSLTLDDGAIIEECFRYDRKNCGAVYGANGSTITIEDGCQIINNFYHSNGVVTAFGSSSQIIMNGGTLSGNRFVSTIRGNDIGTVIYVGTGASFTMNGGSIVDNWPNCGAVGSNGNTTTITLNAGEIKNNVNASGVERALYCNSNSSTTISSGMEVNGKIYVWSDAGLENNGTINGNIYGCYDAEITNNGTINGNVDVYTYSTYPEYTAMLENNGEITGIVYVENGTLSGNYSNVAVNTTDAVAAIIHNDGSVTYYNYLFGALKNIVDDEMLVILQDCTLYETVDDKPVSKKYTLTDSQYNIIIDMAGHTVTVADNPETEVSGILTNPDFLTATASSRLGISFSWDSTSGVTGIQNPFSVANDGTLTLPECNLSRSGYTFTGWRCTSSSDANSQIVGVTYQVGDTIENLTESLVFEPVWVSEATSSSSAGHYRDIAYRITVEDAKNGAVEASDTRAYAGDRVTITVTPDEGYELESLVVLDACGDEVTLTDKGDGVYTFYMPDTHVTITATFAVIAEEEVLGTLIKQDPATPFTDISTNRYHTAIAYVYDAGLMNGMTATTFEPDSTLTRGMIVTVLYRLAGEPAVSGSSIFADVADGQWYTNAIIWATENGIVNGYGNGSFGPNDEVTREQMMAIFYRYASQNGYYMGNTFALDGFTDNADVSAYAVTALEWGFANTMIQSRTTAMINPTDAATRAEVAQALYILIK